MANLVNSDSSSYDRSNEDLYREILEKIAKLHDREVTLLETDHEEFTNYLAKCKDRKLKFPAKDPPLRSRMSLSRRLPTKSSIKWVILVTFGTFSYTFGPIIDPFIWSLLPIYSLFMSIYGLVLVHYFVHFCS